MIRVRPIVVITLIIALFLAGCLGEGEWEEPTGSEGGDGDTMVVVRSLEEDHHGKSLPGVVIRANPIQRNLSTVVLFTDSDGEARFHLWANQSYRISTKSPEHVSRHAQVQSPLNRSDEMIHEAPLLHRHKQIEWDATWPGPAEVRLRKLTDGAVEDIAWMPSRGIFSQNESVEQEYLRHLKELDVHIQWTNNLTVHADLGIGIDGRPSDMPRFFFDENDQASEAGLQEEKAHLGMNEIGHHGIRSGTGLHVGIGTQHLIVAPFDLHANISVDAQFDTVPKTAPGPPPFLIVFGVLGILFAAGTSRFGGNWPIIR